MKMTKRRKKPTRTQNSATNSAKRGVLRRLPRLTTEAGVELSALIFIMETQARQSGYERLSIPDAKK
jgi:hypothetical protein